MKVYLIRHGKPNPVEQDPKKGLMEEGRAEAYNMAHFLKNALDTAPEIYHSQKLRAQQTAAIFHEVLTGSRMVEKVGMAPNDDIGPLQSELSDRDQDLVIVGHLPYLSALAHSLLLGNQNRAIWTFKTASVLALEFADGKWKLEFAISPDLLSK